MNLDFLIARLKTLRAALTTAQLLSLIAAFLVVVAVIVGAAWWINTPTYRVLFSDLDPESAGRVAERLKAQKVPFELGDGGRTVSVPEAQIDQLRLDFAVSGLPDSGRMGFEIFDQTQFGATEFMEEVNLRRALEGEIARTIATIGEVASARVHIAPARDRLFGPQEESAKASVVLKLRTNRAPAPTFIQGIAALVAAAVEGLRPEAVVIMDTSGRPLARPGGEIDEPLSGTQLQRQREVEEQMARQVIALLEAAAGPGRVRANVSARLHQYSEDQVEERWDPQTVVRSTDVTMEGSGGTALTQGVAGAQSNLPGPVPAGGTGPSPTTLAAASPTTPIANPVRYREVRNHEVNVTRRHTVRPSGGVARLSVAVVVDDEHYVETGKDGKAVEKTRPRSAEQIQRFHQLVAAALGLDTAGGDQVTVQNIAFNEPPVEELPEPGLIERYQPQVQQGLEVLVIVVLGTLAFLLVGRPLMRRVVLDAHPVDEPVSLPKQLPKTIEEIEGEIAAQLDAVPTSTDRRIPVLTRRLSGLAQKEPEVAARLVRTWLMEDKK